jgi:hypothetical protein
MQKLKSIAMLPVEKKGNEANGKASQFKTAPDK